MENGKGSKTIGRPRAFDVDQALENAMRVFWQKGYEGTSLTDLTDAMGINRPSLYAAFGNKEELFKKAIERYSNGHGAFLCEALQKPTAREVVEGVLYGSVDAMTCNKSPQGCMAVTSALACSQEAEHVRQDLALRREMFQCKLTTRLQRAVDEGDLPASVSAEELARYVATVSHGLAVQAASGSTREQLKSVVAFALRGCPIYFTSTEA